MDAEEALLLVVPAMFLLLAAGGLASYIEAAVYQFCGSSTVSGELMSQARLEGEYHQRRTDLARLRDEKSRLDEDVSAQMKERANLQDQERRMGDRQKNQVAEAGYPAPGTPGFYFRIEGPAAVMPFAGLASLPTAMGGKRRVRLVVWAANMEAAQALVLNWAGDGSKVIDARDFAGKLYWHEA